MSRSMVSAKEAMMSTPLYDYSTRSGGLDGYTGMYVRTYIRTEERIALSHRVGVTCHL